MTVWSTGLAAVAVLFLIVIPIWGAQRFRPHRARSVKYGEAITERIVQQHVAIVSIAHPDYHPRDRLDRHPWYVIPHMCVFGYAVAVFSGAKLTSNVLSLGASTRWTMATCFIVGAVLVLAGSLMGARVGPWRIRRKVVDHVTCEILGDDVTVPYGFGIAGGFAVAVSMGIYASTSFQSTTGSLGGWLTLGGTVAFALLAAQLWGRMRRFEREDRILIADATASLLDRGDDNAA